MFRETQEDFLRNLLFDDQEDDFDFFNSNNNASQMNSNMDGNLLFTQNDQVLETDNNPFSTNSVFNNNKMNDFEKQQEEINQHLTEITLNNNNSINEAGYQNNPHFNNYRNSFTLNTNPDSRAAYIGNSDTKFNGLSYDIRDGTGNIRFEEYPNQQNSNGYYRKSLDNGINDANNNRGLNQSLYIQPANQYYGNSNSNNKEVSIDYDQHIGSPVNQNGNGYYTNPQQPQLPQNQSFDAMSSPSQQPANPYNDQFQINGGNYYGNNQQQQLPQKRDNRGYFVVDQQMQHENNRGFYEQQQHQQPQQSAAAGGQNLYDQGYIKNAYHKNYQQETYGNQSDNANNTLQQGIQQTPEYYNNQSRQYSQNQQQYYNYAFQASNNTNSSAIYNNDQQPYYQNYEIQQLNQEQSQQQQQQIHTIGEAPYIGELRKRKNNAKLSNGLPLSKKSSSIKDIQQQKYEKKFQKSQQSQKVQQQIIKNINANNQLSSSATTLQYNNAQGVNGENINASQYSSTENNLPVEAQSSNATFAPVQLNQNNSNQQSNTQTAQNSYQSPFYNGYQSHSHPHHCCDGDDEDDDDDHQENEIENEDTENHNQKDLLHSGIQHSSQLNDSNSNEENKDKSYLSCDQEGDSEKNSKADEIAILAESIKHCNKKNVVKNIMSAFLTFMNDRKNKIYTKQEQETIPTLYYSIAKAEGSTEDEEQIEEIRKKFKRYISQKSLNHYTVRLLILHPNYGPIFKHYLTNPIKKWINNSKVADLGAHIKMIGFFLACFQDNRVLEELKRHEKKRAHFS